MKIYAIPFLLGLPIVMLFSISNAIPTQIQHVSVEANTFEHVDYKTTPQSNEGINAKDGVHALTNNSLTVPFELGPSNAGTGYIIAASDASPSWKAEANVICTGTNDQTTIAAAFNLGY